MQQREQLVSPQGTCGPYYKREMNTMASRELQSTLLEDESGSVAAKQGGYYGGCTRSVGSFRGLEREP